MLFLKALSALRFVLYPFFTFPDIAEYVNRKSKLDELDSALQAKSALLEERHQTIKRYHDEVTRLHNHVNNLIAISGVRTTREVKIPKADWYSQNEIRSQRINYL